MMIEFEAKWTACSPDWISKWNACGSTVRRVITEVCEGDGGECADHLGHWAQVGHEHLMGRPAGIAGLMADWKPVRHESGEPA